MIVSVMFLSAKDLLFPPDVLSMHIIIAIIIIDIRVRRGMGNSLREALPNSIPYTFTMNFGLRKRSFQFLHTLISLLCSQNLHVLATAYPVIVLFVLLQDGTAPPNPTVGRALMGVVSSVPQVEGAKLEQLMNNTMQVGVVFSY